MKNLLKSLICLTLSFYSTFSLSCVDKNLQTEKDSPLRTIPTYDQDGIGSCYSYQACVLMDYERLKSGYGASGLSHPVWLAYQYSTIGIDRDHIEGGHGAKTINRVRSEGVCDDKVVQEALNDYKKKNNITDAELMYFIQQVYELWEKESNITARDVVNDARITCSRERGLNISSDIYDKLIEPFKTNDGKVKKIIPVQLLTQIFDRCKGKKLFTPAIREAKATCAKCTDSEIDKKIESLLKDNQPVGVDYCSAVLSDKAYRGLESQRNDSIRFKSRVSRILQSKDPPAEKINKKKGCGLHASVITGSRNHNGKCQYLLKNSWGDVRYKNWPNCICEVRPGVYEQCKRGDKKSNSVGCWIDKEALTSNIVELNHF